MKYSDGGKLRVGRWKKGQNPFPPTESPRAVPEVPRCLGRCSLASYHHLYRSTVHAKNQHKTMRWETLTPKTQAQGERFQFTIWLWAFQKAMQKEKHHELHGWSIFSLVQALMGSKFVFLVLQIKELGCRGHRSFAQVDRAKLNLNLSPSQLSFPEFLYHFALWLFPPALKYSSSLNLDRSKAHSGQQRLWPQQDSHFWVTGSLS